MLKYFLVILFFIFPLLPHKSFADCSRIAWGTRLLEESDAVFEGTSVKTSRSWLSYITFLWNQKYYTRFKVTEKFKGDVGDTVDVFYSYSPSSRPTMKPIEEDLPFLVFTQKDEKGEYYFAPCKANYILIDKQRKHKSFNEVAAETVIVMSKFPNFKHDDEKQIAWSALDQSIRSKREFTSRSKPEEHRPFPLDKDNIQAWYDTPLGIEIYVTKDALVKWTEMRNDRNAKGQIIFSVSGEVLIPIYYQHFLEGGRFIADSNPAILSALPKEKEKTYTP